MMMNKKGNTPQSQKKRRNLADPTKAAAAAAMFTSTSTAWHLHFPIILMKYFSLIFIFDFCIYQIIIFSYFQLIFNTFIGIGILYLTFSATRTILHDAQLKVDERLQGNQ